MSMDKPEGFPWPAEAPDMAAHMTLRDYFAAAALPQAIAQERHLRASMLAPEHFRFDEVAEAAYRMADAMIAEHAK